MAETLIGAAALERRLQAIASARTPQTMLRGLAVLGVANAKVLVHRKTGNLGRSIAVGFVTATSAQIVATANYARYVEEGTGPHEITPRARTALRFSTTAAGRRLSGTPRRGATDVVFARRVHHPGTKPYPFLVPGAQLAITQARLGEQVVAVWNGAA